MTFQALLARFKQERAAFRNRIGELDPARATHKTNQTAWSPAQVIGHIAIAEQSYVNAIVEAAELGIEGTPTQSLMIPIGCLIMNLGIPIPNPREMEPPSEIDLNEALQGFDSAGEAFIKWMEAAEDPSHQVMAKTGMLGNVTAHQMLKMMDAHLTYHKRKLERSGAL
jgi:uncharacterized damage-inducible protein DinB